MEILFRMSYNIIVNLQRLSYFVRFQFPMKEVKENYLASYLISVLFQNYFKLKKIWWLFIELYKDFH